jgi:hypothetical protein
MKKRLLPIILTIILIMTFIPMGPAALATGEFTAQFGAQFDTDVNADVGEWPDLSDYEVTFNLDEEVTITIEFDDPVAFGGNYAAINTDVPFPDGTGIITSFKLDGEEISMGPAFLNDEGIRDGLRLTICNKWNNDISPQPLDLDTVGEFSKLEITFIVSMDPLGGKAWIGGTFLNEDGDFDWIEFDDQSVDFIVGVDFTVTLDFGDDTNEHGDAGWGFITVVQTDMQEDASTLGAVINSILVDGEEIDFEPENVEVGFDRGIRVALTSLWAEDPVVAGYEVIGEFSKLEVNLRFFSDDTPPAEIEVPDDMTMAGNAWIGGTFLTEEGEFDWIPYEDQKTSFTVGEPFTVTLDFGSDTQTHGEASWGYITVVQTDIMDSAALYDAFIDKILVDGREILFNPHNIEVGFDNGVRVALTSYWAEDPVVETPRVIGEFSKLEVVMAFTVVGGEFPFGEIEPPPPPTPPVIASPIVPPGSNNDTSDGLPGWVIPVIIAGVVVVALVIVLVVLKSKKKPS